MEKMSGSDGWAMTLCVADGMVVIEWTDGKCSFDPFWFTDVERLGNFHTLNNVSSRPPSQRLCNSYSFQITVLRHITDPERLLEG